MRVGVVGIGVSTPVRVVGGWIRRDGLVGIGFRVIAKVLLFFLLVFCHRGAMRVVPPVITYLFLFPFVASLLAEVVNHLVELPLRRSHVPRRVREIHIVWSRRGGSHQDPVY
jgi:hypothetical protein